MGQGWKWQLINRGLHMEIESKGGSRKPNKRKGGQHESVCSLVVEVLTSTTNQAQSN